MKTYSLNLLPWRENQFKRHLCQDVLLCVLLIGCLSLLCELYLLLSKNYQTFLLQRQNKIAQQLANHQSSFEQAQKQYDLLLQLKKQFNEQKKNQIQQKNLLQNLAAIANEKPDTVKIFTISWENNTWQITGYAKTIDDVVLYQKHLQAINFNAQIERWKPNSNANSTNFQLAF